jgi:hypothetical protein
LRMANPFIYECPNTGRYVHGWSESKADDLLSYEGVICPVCQRIHAVNVRTGRVAGAEEKTSQEHAMHAD